MAMSVWAEPFRTPKAGHAPDEYEDACYPDAPCDLADDVFRCAVADGATETSFSGLWAELLVRAYCGRRLPARDVVGALPPLQQAWRERVSAQPLPWYAEQKAEQGAFASLLGLTLVAVGEVGGHAPGRWTALAVGDSCLFHVRDGRLLRAFPLDRAAQFTSRPALLASVNPANRALNAPVSVASGEWASGDTFYLATDALAQWFLAAVEAGRRLRPLPRGLTACNFSSWIGELRGDRRLRNDDVTLLRVDVTEGAAPHAPA